MSGMKRGAWEKIFGRRKKPVRSHCTSRPFVEELSARIVAAALTWNGGTSAWGTAANWNVTGGGHAVPGVNDDVVLANTSNDPIIAAGSNVVIGSLTMDTSWGAGNTLKVQGSIAVQGDGATGHGEDESSWDAGTLDLSAVTGSPTPYLEVTGGNKMIFDGGTINSDSTLGSVYVDNGSGVTQSKIIFTSQFSDITANLFIGKTPGGVESQEGSISFDSGLNAGVYLHGISTITVNDHGTLNLTNSAMGSLGGIRYDPADNNVTAHIDLLENGTVNVTAPNAQPMPLPNITEENGTLWISGRATINRGNGQLATTPGIKLDGGFLVLDSGAYVTSDLTATGNSVWWNPSPSSGSATTVLAGKVIWSSAGYISIGDMGNGVGHFTNWVQLQCNDFIMNSGTLNIGVGTAGGGMGVPAGDTLLVQGSVTINGALNGATLAVYAMTEPVCHTQNLEQPFLTATNGGTLTGSFASVVAYAGCEWTPTAWNQEEKNGQVFIYWT
jgi:hypothetical protein